MCGCSMECGRIGRMWPVEKPEDDGFVMRDDIRAGGGDRRGLLTTHYGWLNGDRRRLRESHKSPTSAEAVRNYEKPPDRNQKTCASGDEPSRRFGAGAAKGAVMAHANPALQHTKDVERWAEVGGTHTRDWLAQFLPFGNRGEQ
ncbi:hypothetical protein ZHAS_00016111 [Anopheles sinensis]|uniref:Uncharacterized protein n=1 Tax=Anopheles sinensis TaxID=74873 RepID=A0A084WCQ5_ANOSI|nr:hypothetical protein ZHAS_00016111 [Anopheles sinensis]